MSLYVLSIDTTSVFGSVALSDGRNLIAEEQQGVRSTHSERLIESIDHLLNLAGWKKSELQAIAVALGPGSFTGLRIGLGTAKGMALALSLPIVGVSSLESLALNAAGFGGTVVTLIDARRGELYAAGWKVTIGARPKPVFNECVIPPKKLTDRIKKIKGGIILVGDGAIAYRDFLKTNLGKRAQIAEGSMALAQAHNLALLSFSKLKRNKSDDLAGLVPNYIRHSDAEIGFMGKK